MVEKIYYSLKKIKTCSFLIIHANSFEENKIPGNNNMHNALANYRGYQDVKYEVWRLFLAYI